MDLWTDPLVRAPRLNAHGRSPVDDRMDNPAGCPRAHPQAVGCPQAPQGPTTREEEPQAIPRAPLRYRMPVNQPPRRPSTSQLTHIPTISIAQRSTEPQIGHVPEINGHVRRNTHFTVPWLLGT